MGANFLNQEISRDLTLGLAFQFNGQQCIACGTHDTVPRSMWHDIMPRHMVSCLFLSSQWALSQGCSELLQSQACLVNTTWPLFLWLMSGLHLSLMGPHDTKAWSWFLFNVSRLAWALSSLQVLQKHCRNSTMNNCNFGHSTL